MSYTKQNFIKGQILKADHLNAMDTGIESNDLAIAELSEEIDEIKPGIVTLVEEGANLFDRETMYTWGHWVYFTGDIGAGKEIAVVSNQYTGWYAAIKIPVEGKKSITISTNDASICVLNWYAANSNMLALEYKTGIATGEMKVGGGCTFNLPDGTEWLCLTLASVTDYHYGTGWIMANEGSEALPYEPYGSSFSKSRLMAYGKTLLTAGGTEKKSNVTLELPEKYALVVDDTFEVFYKGIVNAVNPDLYYIEVQCAIGSAYAKRYICTPTAQDVGDHSMRVKLYDQEHNLLDEKTVTLSVKAKATASPSSETVVLYVGDSLAVGGGTPGEFKRRLTATGGAPAGDSLSNISFIGTCSGNGASYEGWGGYSFNTYTTEGKGNTFMWITTTHDKTNDDQHSIYKDADGG